MKKSIHSREIGEDCQKNEKQRSESHVVTKKLSSNQHNRDGEVAKVYVKNKSHTIIFFLCKNEIYNMAKSTAASRIIGFNSKLMVFGMKVVFMD